MHVLLLFTRQFCCAGDFFLEHGEHERGVQLLIQARQPSRALDLCHQHNITITEVSFTPRLLLRPGLCSVLNSTLTAEFAVASPAQHHQHSITSTKVSLSH